MDRLPVCYCGSHEGMIPGTLDWSVIQATVDALHTFHPHATTWVSAQELSVVALAAFVDDLRRSNISALLTGVVYGPHVIVPLTKVFVCPSLRGAFGCVYVSFPSKVPSVVCTSFPPRVLSVKCMCLSLQVLCGYVLQIPQGALVV